MHKCLKSSGDAQELTSWIPKYLKTGNIQELTSGMPKCLKSSNAQELTSEIPKYLKSGDAQLRTPDTWESQSGLPNLGYPRSQTPIRANLGGDS